MPSSELLAVLDRAGYSRASDTPAMHAARARAAATALVNVGVSDPAGATILRDELTSRG